MIPLFKSHFSIGKSILNFEDIFSFDESEIVLIEDSFGGLRGAVKKSKETGKVLRFGLRIDCSDGNGASKLVFFAKNDEGIKSLFKIYTKAKTEEEDGVYKLNRADLKNILVAVPFYDSFVHNSLHQFGIFEMDISDLNPVYFEEDNEHPFDRLISRALKDLGIKTEKAKSIYYKKREDFPAFQFYKASCKKGGRPPKFDSPEIPNLSSPEFCYESYVCS